MANGEQIRKNIRHAQERVAQYGYLSRQRDAVGEAYVTDRDVMLAGFGYLADRIDAAEQNVIRLKIEGKKFLAVGMSLGGILVGGVSELIRRLA